MNGIAVKPELLIWARERSGIDEAKLYRRFSRLSEWEEGTRLPTLKQLVSFAETVHVPVGYLFFPEPPVEKLPIPDLRTIGDKAVRRPSPELLDTVHLCQERQEWYREHIRNEGGQGVSFVGSAGLKDNPVDVAQDMRGTLKLSVEERATLPRWTDALRQMLEKADEAGVLVMVSSIVASNTHRRLDAGEFRGFALVDEQAPLVFINASDSKAAQMFTLGHELAHLWLGEGGVSDVQAGRVSSHKTEKWCNQVAAELLVPMEAFKQRLGNAAGLEAEVKLLSNYFKVSTLVILRRLYDAGVISKDALWEAYRAESGRILKAEAKQGGGGDFYKTLAVRTGKRFARAVLASAMEGQTMLREAGRLLGFRKVSTLEEAARKLEVVA